MRNARARYCSRAAVAAADDIVALAKSNLALEIERQVFARLIPPGDPRAKDRLARRLYKVSKREWSRVPRPRREHFDMRGHLVGLVRRDVAERVRRLARRASAARARAGAVEG